VASRHLGVQAVPSQGRTRTEAHRSPPLPRVVPPPLAGRLPAVYRQSVRCLSLRVRACQGCRRTTAEISIGLFVTKQGRAANLRPPLLPHAQALPLLSCSARPASGAAGAELAPLHILQSLNLPGTSYSPYWSQRCRPLPCPGRELTEASSTAAGAGRRCLASSPEPPRPSKSAQTKPR
jgi:hypothetical protein